MGGRIQYLATYFVTCAIEFVFSGCYFGANLQRNLLLQFAALIFEVFAFLTIHIFLEL